MVARQARAVTSGIERRGRGPERRGGIAEPREVSDGSWVPDLAH